MNPVVGALACVWLGMVVALSFVEAPLRFRVPGVTLRLGLAIGRRVFAALNTIELALAAVIVVAAAVGTHPGTVRVSAAAAVAVLLVQVGAVRPVLSRRSDRVLAGADGLPRSRAHQAYIGLELVKVVALGWLAVAAL